MSGSGSFDWIYFFCLDLVLLSGSVSFIWIGYFCLDLVLLSGSGLFVRSRPKCSECATLPDKGGTRALFHAIALFCATTVAKVKERLHNKANPLETTE